MLACLHECRGKGSCTQWPYFSILQGLTTYRVSFLQVPSSHLREGILILISKMILYITLVLNPFQIVTSVLHKKVKGASSHLTIKKAGQKHQAENHGQARNYLLNPDHPTELPAKLFLLPAWNDFYMGHFKVEHYSYLQLDYFEIKL